MARNQVVGIGKGGIVKDIKPSLLPAEYWTDGRNVRFETEKCYGMGGVVPIFSTAVPGILNCAVVVGLQEKTYIYTTGDKVFKYFLPGPAEDISRVLGGPYLENPDNLFDIYMYNGYAIFNNGIDLPQVWNPSSGVLVDLPNWPVTMKARALKQFKGLLLAFGLTEGATFYEQRMRWSHPAETGAVPSSWDETNPDFDAGVFDFPDTNTGQLVSGELLGERFYVYKEQGIHALSYVGGQTVLARNTMPDRVGLSVPRSLVTIPTTKQGIPAHFFAGDESFYMNDGLKCVPFFQDVFKNEILQIVNRNYYKTRSFAVVHPRAQEVWFCVPEAGAEYPTLAFCFNYQTYTYSIRELSGTANIVSSIGLDYTEGVAVSDLTHSDDTLFEDDVGYYDTATTPSKGLLLEASPVLENLYSVDQGTLDYDGQPYPRWVEKVSIAAVKNDPRNYSATIQDYAHRKLCSAVIPKLYAGDCLIQVGAQETDRDAVMWSDDLPAQASYRKDLPTPVSGRFLSFRFKSLGEEEFALGGFDYELDVLGEF